MTVPVLIATALLATSPQAAGQTTELPPSGQRLAQQRNLAEQGIRDVRNKTSDVSACKEAYANSARDMNAWLDAFAAPLLKGDKVDRNAVRARSTTAAKSLLTYINAVQTATGVTPVSVHEERLQRVGKQLETAAQELYRVPSRTISREEHVRRLDEQLRWKDWDDVQ